MALPLLGLVAIVKNESHGIADTLRPLLRTTLGKLPDGSLTPEICLKSGPPLIDHWTIVDTGSTDDTKDKIALLMEVAGVPGTLYERAWTDFSTARNEALDLHGAATQFVLMLDADDIVHGAEQLRAWLQDLVDSGAPLDAAYRVSLKGVRDSDDDYALSLVINTTMGPMLAPRYVGRVHEVLAAPASVTIPGVQIVKIYRARSAEASAKRWHRDLEILQEDHKADPSSARTVFYLAQTYECLGKIFEARKYYRKRVAMGGWAEEVFEAMRRLAKLTQDEALKVIENLRAHQHSPHRAEPLYEIAAHFHKTDQHALTYAFASRAAQIPEPITNMFVDREVYRHKAADLVAISAFYLSGGGARDPAIYEAGKRAADQCIKARPDDQRLRANRAFYIGAAPCVISEINWTPEAPYHAGNPSILRSPDGRWLCLLRTTNYKIVDGNYLTPDDNVIYTRNVMLELDEHLKVTRAVPMEDLPLSRREPRTDFPVHGYEDCRLFADDNGQLYATCTVCDLEGSPKGSRELCLLVIHPQSYAIEACAPLRGPWSQYAQKNWMPIGVAHNNTAQLVYRTDGARPVIAEVTLDPVSCALRFAAGVELDIAPGHLRGGSQAVDVWYDNDWRQLAIVHEVAFPGGMERIYSHRFVLFEKDATKVLGMSDLFYFKRRGIEFCAGLATDGVNKLVASFSVQDSAAYFATFHLAAVLASIKPDYVV